jgi:hypothetical protein
MAAGVEQRQLKQHAAACNPHSSRWSIQAGCTHESGASAAPVWHQAGWWCGCEAAVLFLDMCAAVYSAGTHINLHHTDGGVLRAKPSKQQRCSGGYKQTCISTCMHGIPPMHYMRETGAALMLVQGGRTAQPVTKPSARTSPPFASSQALAVV